MGAPKTDRELWAVIRRAEPYVPMWLHTWLMAHSARYHRHRIRLMTELALALGISREQLHQQLTRGGIAK